ncbi:MAG: recombinase family protein [Armatimonadetes bacterium]|nr:recombinase family protein [Armatimonadota bacterium]
MGTSSEASGARGAVLYTRVSTGEQAEHGTSLDSQREACLREALRLGLPVVAVCEDAGVSGAMYETRPGIMEVLRLIEGGAASALIVTKIDRIGRSARVILDIADRVERAGGELVTRDVPLDRSPMGRMMRTMLAGMAEMEREAIRERMAGGKRSRAEQGQQPQRSRPPYGYHVVTNAEVDAGLHPPAMRGRYVVDEGKAAIARRIFADYLRGLTLSRIARTLNREGVPPPGDGRGWHPATVNVILTNPAYKGEPVSGRQKCLTDNSRIGQRHKLTGVPLTTPDVRVPAPPEQRLTLSAPALVSAEDWEAVQRRMAQNRQALNGDPRRALMLSGMTVCPHCGGKAVLKYQNANGK